MGHALFDSRGVAYFVGVGAGDLVHRGWPVAHFAGGCRGNGDLPIAEWAKGWLAALRASSARGRGELCLHWPLERGGC